MDVFHVILIGDLEPDVELLDPRQKEFDWLDPPVGLLVQTRRSFYVTWIETFALVEMAACGGASSAFQ